MKSVGCGMLNALTIDVEDWYHGNDFNVDFRLWDAYEDRVCDSTERILDLLLQHHVRATFFVLGYVAGKHPRLVRRIQQCGHEIGTHCYRHRLVYAQAPAEYREDLVRSRAVIEDITGQTVTAHRAPSWSITRRSLWALDILEEEGFAYDSSIFPVRTPLFGVRGAPCSPYKPRRGRVYGLTEFPPSVAEALRGAVRVPFSGGFFLRSLPYLIIRNAISSLNATARPAMVYLHPWELDASQPRLRASVVTRFVHYHNIDTTEEKVRMLLREFSFGPAADVLASTDAAALTI